MPQRIITIWICSLCAAESDSQDKVARFELAGAGRTLAYDICDTCQAAEPFAGFVAAGIRESKMTREDPTSTRVVCQYCDQSFTPQGLGLHQSKAHNVRSKTAALLEVRGGRGPNACPECEFKAESPQGLGAHRRAAHGVVGAKAKR